jgi:glycosyltransferase involved in cell wall biosynthesis
MPKISIVIPSYNHAQFIHECINSVLLQTFQDFEIIITDDGSSDRSIDIINQFRDPRIILYRNKENTGACTTLNNCIKKASGELIAVLNSDDAWEPNKLEKQVSYLDIHHNIAAVFTKVTFVNELSEQISANNYRYFFVFDQDNRSNYEWLNYFFSKGNCLCHPSILIRKYCYDEIGLHDERMASVPDLDMWVRLCMKHEIHVLDEKLVRFRIRNNELNASGNKISNHIRTHFEYKHILDHYLEISDVNTFVKIFPNTTNYGQVDKRFIPYFLAKLAIDINYNSWRLWGLDLINQILKDPEKAKDLEYLYKFRYLDFYRLTSQYDVFNMRSVVLDRPLVQIAGITIYLNTRSIIGKVSLWCYDTTRKFIKTLKKALSRKYS